ncbi:MAG: sortase [Acidimicrobiia bacterium]
MTDVTQDQAVSPASPPSSHPAIKTVRFAGWSLIWAGLFLLGFVGHQLFVTTWFAQQNNVALEEEAQVYFDAAKIQEVEYLDPLSPSEVDEDATDPATGEPVDPATDEPVPTLLVEAPPPQGQPFAIIRIPTIDRLQEGWTVVEGVRRADLRNGAGHMPTTPLPGQPGNSVISGHRTTYGAPFHELDQLSEGDLIEVETALGVHTYAVRESIIVKPTEIWVTGDRPGAWLTLTTCHPKFSSRQRLIVFAELVDGPNAAVIVG